MARTVSGCEQLRLGIAFLLFSIIFGANPWGVNLVEKNRAVRNFLKLERVMNFRGACVYGSLVRTLKLASLLLLRT